ncbi:hypothetical protein [Marinimicrobium sp. ARAG 43.8]|uniref:hypothetical protein n=1 Tax=Marinimicrobium sp. ARAG 43.8 TaxID=3418719 RepID=UPI003CF70CFD
MDWSVMLSLAEFFNGTPLQTAGYASMAALFFLLVTRRSLFLIRPLARLLSSLVMQLQRSVRELLSLPADVARRLASIEPYFAIVSSLAMMVAGVSIGGVAVLALRTSGETVAEITQLFALGTLPLSALYCRISFCELCRAVDRGRS